MGRSPPTSEDRWASHWQKAAAPLTSAPPGPPAHRTRARRPQAREAAAGAAGTPARSPTHPLKEKEWHAVANGSPYRTDAPSPATRARRERPDLMDPQSLAQLGGMELIARSVVEGFLMGLHRSPHRGFSAEFAELRPYQPGDDLRHIDWRMYGRSDRFYVKQFEEETSLRAQILVDVSASMAWSSDDSALPPKVWYAKQLAASLALILVRQGDSVGLSAFHDRVVLRVGPRGGRRQWYEILRRLTAVEAGGGTSAGSALKELAVRVRRRGLIILLSDLLVDPEETRTALRYLRHQGHEVLVFHLMDPGERELPAASDARFLDPETGQELQVSVADIRDEYRRAVEESVREWEQSLRPHGIDYQLIGTDRPLSRALRAYLHKRERLG